MNQAIRLCVMISVACTNRIDLGNHHPIAADDGSIPVVDGGVDGRPIPPQGKLFFVTEGAYSGDLAKEGQASSGEEGADEICRREATSAGKGGTFRAWVSTPTKAAKDRIQGNGPWLLADGNLIFARHPSLEPPVRFPAITASGEDLFFSSDAKVWTGTRSMGTASSETCSGWATSGGEARGTFGFHNFVSQWTEYPTINGSGIESDPCASRHHLYCFEQ